MVDFPQLIGRPTMVKRAIVERKRFYQYRLEEIEKEKEKIGEFFSIAKEKALFEFCSSIVIAENWVLQSLQIMHEYRMKRLFVETERERRIAKDDQNNYAIIAKRLEKRVKEKWLKELQNYLSDAAEKETSYDFVQYWPLLRLQRFMINSQEPIEEERYVQYEMIIDKLIDRETYIKEELSSNLAESISNNTVEEFAKEIKSEFVEDYQSSVIGINPITDDIVIDSGGSVRYYPRNKDGKELVEWAIEMYEKRIQHLEEWRLDKSIPKIGE